MDEVSLKEFKTFDEQLDILRNRNLVIDNPDFAKAVLMRVNYYRFTAYLFQFKIDQDNYMPGTKFDKIYNIYEFDRKLRNITITLLEHIEIAFRTYIAYTHSKKYGPDGYLNPSNFLNRTSWSGKDFHTEFCEILDCSKKSNKHRAFVQHHISSYSGKMPLWVATEILTFANISKLYSNLLPSEKGYIKQHFVTVNVDFVENWLECLTGVRNACAHSHRIYNEDFMLSKILKRYKGNNLNSRKFFNYVIAMRYLTNSDFEWDAFYIRLDDLIREYRQSIDLALLGFPENWNEILTEPIKLN